MLIGDLRGVQVATRCPHFRSSSVRDFAEDPDLVTPSIWRGREAIDFVGTSPIR
jgi:hypothetical protein